MNMCKYAVLALGLLVAAPALAEQRFYQVMDAQGRMQTIMLPDESAPGAKAESGKTESGKAEPEKAEAEKTEPETGEQSNTPAAATPADPSATLLPAAVPAPVPDSVPGSVAPATPAAAGAPSGQESVDDQEYLDSEALERSNFNPEKKKRFYLLNDGMGSRIEESDGAAGGDRPDAPLFMAPKETPAYVKVLHAAPVDVQAHDALLAVFNGAIRKSPEGKPLCLGKADRKNAQALAPDVSATVVIDSKARHFLGAAGVVSVFSVEGEGLRSIVVKSVSRSDRNPAFVAPVFAYADASGCVIRVTASGYFEHWLAATNSRHPLLEGRLTMLSGERFLLVVLPDGRHTASASDFPSSTDGVLAVKWHEQHEKSHDK